MDDRSMPTEESAGCSLSNQPTDGAAYLREWAANIRGSCGGMSVDADQLEVVADEMERLRAGLKEIGRLRTALTEISKGEGIFSRDPLTHATNTIESMKQLALDALQG